MPDEHTQPSSHWVIAIQNRLIDFAVRIIKVADALPETRAGRHVAGQVLRSGTSPAPNYGEARAAESRDDFIHKMKIVLKELNETLVWLQMIHRGNLLPGERLAELLDENDQLCRLFGGSIATAERNHPRNANQPPDTGPDQ